MKKILVYGNRRFIACKKLGWKTIPTRDINTGIVSDSLVEDIRQLDNIRSEIESDDLSELMFNIKQNGLLHPIGITTQMKLKDVDYLILNASENIIRQDISPIEFGKVCLRLKKDYKLSLNEISARFGVPKSRIETALDLFRNIPEKYKNRVGYNTTNHKSNKLSASVAHCITQERISIANKEILMDYARENDSTRMEMEVIMQLMRNGIDIDKSIKIYKQYVSKTIVLIVKKEKWNMLHKKYKVSLSHIVANMLNGKIPLESDIFYQSLKIKK